MKDIPDRVLCLFEIRLPINDIVDIYTGRNVNSISHAARLETNRFFRAQYAFIFLNTLLRESPSPICIKSRDSPVYRALFAKVSCPLVIGRSCSCLNKILVVERWTEIHRYGNVSRISVAFCLQNCTTLRNFNELK